MTTNHVPFDIPEDLRRGLAVEAARSGKSQSRIVAEALEKAAAQSNFGGGSSGTRSCGAIGIALPPLSFAVCGVGRAGAATKAGELGAAADAGTSGW